MASPASTVHVSSVVAVFLFATMSAAAGSNTTASTNATAMALRGSTDKALPAAAAARNGKYTCYQCHKSSSVMIRRCPIIAQDDCHLACLTLPTPGPPLPPHATAAAGADRNADDCYVMKVYPDGSWVVVDVTSCKAATAACYLTCGNGDEHAGDDRAAAGTGTTTPAAARRQLPHGLLEFQRCGDHLTARGAAVAGV
ncbi:unnamed protein product [Urochloa decumbens]|uniref:Uncharacterized protein n=1 Tax=Urochloa decumbens TaxID=240449 RepID=A0ABC8Y9P0_9POAL